MEPSKLDDANPYDYEFREDLQDGDTPLAAIKARVGASDPIRLRVGGVPGLYLIDGVFDAGDRVTIHGRRKPDAR